LMSAGRGMSAMHSASGREREGYSQSANSVRWSER